MEGGAQLSEDGTILAVPCYAGTAGSTISNTASRYVYTVDGSGTVTTTTFSLNNQNLYTALPYSGNVWAAGAGRLVKVPIGSTGATVTNILGGSVTDVYDMQVLNGVQYYSQYSTTSPYAIGTSTPYPSSSVTPSSIIAPTSNWKGGKFFVFSDTVIYATNRVDVTNAAIVKFTKSGGTWSQAASKSITVLPNGIFVRLESGSTVIYFNSATRIFRLVDSGTPTINTGSPTTIANPSNVLIHDLSLVPITPSCTDGIKNQGEADIDCGGPCSTKCANGKTCSTGTDCTSTYCNPNGLCCKFKLFPKFVYLLVSATPSCTDTFKNQGEADVDCGGPCSTKCANGKTCSSGSDCTSSYCNPNGLCCKFKVHSNLTFLIELFSNPLVH